MEHRPEIDTLLRTILEAHFQRVGSNEPKSNDAVNGMLHGLLQWLDLAGWLTGLQEIPVVLQLRAVNLSHAWTSRR